MSDLGTKGDRCDGCEHPRGWHDGAEARCTAYRTAAGAMTPCPCASFDERR